jgi:hypothetical protein
MLLPAAPPLRRLRTVSAHVAAAAAEGHTRAPVDLQWVRPTDELQPVDPLLPPPDESLTQALSLGQLDVRGLPGGTIRAMMRPEPTQPSETEANMSGFMPYHGMTRHNLGHAKIELPDLWDDAAGGVCLAALDRVREMQSEAARAEDYGQAKTLQQLLRVLRPQPRRSALDCAPTGAEAKAQFFFENGFVVLENVIEPDALARLQAAWSQVESETLPQWEDDRSHGVGISRHSFLHMDDGRPNVGRKVLQTANPYFARGCMNLKLTYLLLGVGNWLQLQPVTRARARRCSRPTGPPRDFGCARAGADRAAEIRLPFLHG